MADSSDGDDPHRFAFWNARNRDRDIPAPFHHKEHHERPAARAGERALRIARIVFDAVVVIAWIVLIVLALLYPSDMPDPRFGPL